MTKKPKKVPNMQQVNIRVPTTLVEKIDLLAAKETRTRAGQVEHIVRQYLMTV